MNYCGTKGKYCIYANLVGRCSSSVCINQYNNTITASTGSIEPIENMRLATNCLVCGASIYLTPEEEMTLRSGSSIHSKICDDCKNAIMYAKELLKNYLKG